MIFEQEKQMIDGWPGFISKDVLIDKKPGGGGTGPYVGGITKKW